MHVRRIRIDGVSRTRDWVLAQKVRDVLQARTLGDVVDRADEARLRLKELGIFEKVETVIDVSDGACVSLTWVSVS